MRTAWYRSGRICNWCPKHQTGLADLETKYEERRALYYLKYGPLYYWDLATGNQIRRQVCSFASGRQRYKNINPVRPLRPNGLTVPLSNHIKDKAVDMEFGSGVMTITPAHDPVDLKSRKGIN